MQPRLSLILPLACLLLAGCAADQGASVIRQDRIDAAQRADIAARWKPRLVLGDEALLRGEPIRSPASAKASGMFYPAPTPAAASSATVRAPDRASTRSAQA